MQSRSLLLFHALFSILFPIFINVLTIHPATAQLPYRDDARRARALAPSLDFNAVELGGTHSCALQANGTAYCWGRGNFGQLGNGKEVGSAVPTPVTGGHLFSSLAVGNMHTCAVAYSGSVYCWGSNGSGKLSQESAVVFSSELVQVSGIGNATLVSAGNDHSCAVNSTGHMFCWGTNLYGELGFGSSALSVPSPQLVVDIENVVSIAAGGSHSCATVQNGSLYCWGLGSNGALGTASCEQEWQVQAIPQGTWVRTQRLAVS